MIRVTLEPTKLVVDQPNELTIGLTNVARGRCTNVVFKLALPVQVVLLRGPDRVEVPRLDAGQSITHIVRVRPKRVGTWVLTSSNFSYRDALGQSRRITDLRLAVTVVPVAPAPVITEPELLVTLRTAELPFREWEMLEGQVVNVGQLALQQVAVRAVGPVTCDPGVPWQMLGALRPGETVEFRILVRANESGSKVPVHIEATYTDVVGRTGRLKELNPVRVSPSRDKTDSSAKVVTILFLAADPTDASRLRLGQELRDIQERLQMAKMRDSFALDQRMSVRPVDISQALLDIKPQIVHFSGHGTSAGALCFEDEAGTTQTVQPDALAALFALVADQVNCVVLNACYSEAQANAIAKHINYVIGMSQAISDKTGVAFAVGFYQALGAGRSIEEAYELGRVQIRLQGIPEYLMPVLVKKV